MNFYQISGQILTFASLGVSHNYGAKMALANLQRQWLTQVVKELGLGAGSYQITINQGGAAVAADVTLRAEELFVQFTDSFRYSSGLLVRRCDGMDDAIGHENQYISREDFARMGATSVTMRILELTQAHTEIALSIADRSGLALTA